MLNLSQPPSYAPVAYPADSMPEEPGLAQWGALAAAAMSAAASVYSAKVQKEAAAAQAKANKEIANMQKQVELQKLKLMERQAASANAFMPSAPGGLSAGATIGIGVAALAAFGLIIAIARRRK